MLIHTAPFGTWIVLQTLLPATAGAYAFRSAATLLVLVAASFLFFHFPRPQTPSSPVTGVRPLLLGLIGGLLVLALWVLPESSRFYRTWFCWPLGSLPGPQSGPSPYEPAVCGWALTLAKLVGSAFVIAPAEELFFRSFLYRRLQRRDFAAVPLARFDLSAFLWTIFLFTLEHDRPLAAALAGAIYGFLTIRCGLFSAIVAHVATNLLLAVHVIAARQWAFW